MSDEARIPESEAWQRNFRASTVAMGFRLSLTKNMLEFLCATADDVRWDGFWELLHGLNQCGAGAATAASLVRRGLLVDIYDSGQKLRLVEGTLPDGSPDFRAGRWQLTPAGRAVVDLLRIGGLFIESDQAIARRHGA
jgi:hypothetical protein